MYSGANGNSYCIDKHGVRSTPTNDLGTYVHFDGSPGTWSLVDTPEQQEIPFSITCSMSLYFVFASPRFERFKTLLDHYARRWIMDPWSVEELHRL